VSTLGPESRALLDEGREALLPGAGDRERILESLRTATGGGATPGPEVLQGAAPQAALGGLSWPVVSTIVVGLSFGGGLALHQLSNAGSPVDAPTTLSTLPPPPVTATPSTTPAPVTEDAPPPAPLLPPAETRSPPAHRSSDRLAEEVQLLSRAQKDLYAGRFGAALGLLAEHQRKFPRGRLTQERVAARIQALCGLGRVAEANAELARVSPGSLHAGRAREACASKAK
jgi:hypothetical protein